MIKTKIAFVEDEETEPFPKRIVVLKGNIEDFIADVRAIAYGIRMKSIQRGTTKAEAENRQHAIENAFAEGLRMNEDEISEAELNYTAKILEEAIAQELDENKKDGVLRA
jgi:phosphosulfolactate synthase (CoM biosynthesis protein A)